MSNYWNLGIIILTDTSHCYYAYLYILCRNGMKLAFFFVILFLHAVRGEVDPQHPPFSDELNDSRCKLK